MAGIGFSDRFTPEADIPAQSRDVRVWDNAAPQISAYTCVSALPPGWVTAPVQASPTVWA